MFFSFENGFKMKSQVANENWFMFFDIEENLLEMELNRLMFD